MAEKARRKISDGGGEEADRGHGRSRQATRNAPQATGRAEASPPGRIEMDWDLGHLALRSLWLQSRRRSNRPGCQPQFSRGQGVGQARIQGSRWRGGVGAAKYA